MAFLYVTPDNELRSVYTDGSKDFGIPSAGKVLQVTTTDNADNGQVWVLTSDPDTDLSVGGDILMVSTLDTSSVPTFTPFTKPGGKTFGATSIAAGNDGCYFVEEDGSIHYVDKDGNERIVFPAKTAFDIQRGGDRILVVVSEEIDTKKGGNVIMWFRDIGTNLTLSTVGANKAVGPMAAVQNVNQVVFMQPDGRLASFSPPGDTIFQMGVDFNDVLKLVSNTAGFYAISKEVHNDGGNYIKNIEDVPAKKVLTTKGVDYAEFTSLNTELFQ